MFLRRLHNFAVDMAWLPWPLLPRKRWPAISHQVRRAIKWEEHQAILAREPNAETRRFYDLMWHLGGSQSDVATLRGEDIDWERRLVAYHRMKTGTIARLHFGDVVAARLSELPKSGFLFPRLAVMHEKHRCKQFHRRVQGLGIRGVSLHSYRYAWAERAKTCGFPERFAQEALGHSSKAVHRAYARGAIVDVPSLEEYERARPGAAV
jgi:integrase